MTVARDLCRVSAALCAVLLGLLLALPLHDKIAALIAAGTRDYGVLSSPAAGGYAGYVDNRDPSSSTITMSFTLYNITNAAAVLRGAKPSLVAVGPLRYNYVNTKHNISWEQDGGHMIYTQYQRFFAADDATRALEGVPVTTLNTLLMGALRQQIFDPLLPALEQIWAGDGGAFITRSAYELLWGYPDAALLDLASWPGLQHNDSSLEEALAVHGHVRMATGKSDPLQGYNYVEWSGRSKLECCVDAGVAGEVKGAAAGTCAPYWFSYDAQTITGSFGTSFHPNVDPAETLTVATHDFGPYRHWPLQCLPGSDPRATVLGAGSLYDASPLTAGIGGCDSYDVKGVRLSRFALPSWVLGNASVPEAVAAGETDGYGVTGPSGLLDVAPCYFSAPIRFSKPAFLDASDELRNAVDGLPAPSRDEHNSFLGVEPVTGRVLDFKFQVQINAFFEPVTIDGLFGVPCASECLSARACARVPRRDF